jgi:heptosyltransferase-1
LKILIVKPSSLGDVIQALPVLRLLKIRYPESTIHWWLAENLFPLLAGDPHIDVLIPFNRNAWRSFTGLSALIETISRTRCEEYDLVIDLQGLARSGLLTWLARGTQTIGIDLPKEGARLFYDSAVPRPSKPHAVDWYLEVAKQLDLPMEVSFEWIPTRTASRSKILKEHPLRGKRIIGVVPGARWNNKRWPAEHFTQTLNQLASSGEYVFSILGGSGDRAFAGTLCDRKDAIDLLGKTDLAEMIEWVRRCELVITNDTGPMHVAAALGRPTIGLFGPTRPDQTGPYQQLANSLSVPMACAPCLKSTCAHGRYMACLEDLNPISVAARANILLAKG